MMVRTMVLAAVVVITTATPAEAAPTGQSAGGTGPAAGVAAAGMAPGEGELGRTTADGAVQAGASTGNAAAGQAGSAGTAAAQAKPGGAAADSGPSTAKCDAGSFCAWGGANYTGKVARLNLETANPNQCVTLPDNLVAKSLANLMTRDVTVYEGATCSTEAEFTTYPKGGTYVPDAPFVVRAIQVW